MRCTRRTSTSRSATSSTTERSMARRAHAARKWIAAAAGEELVFEPRRLAQVRSAALREERRAERRLTLGGEALKQRVGDPRGTGAGRMLKVFDNETALEPVT